MGDRFCYTPEQRGYLEEALDARSDWELIEFSCKRNLWITRSHPHGVKVELLVRHMEDIHMPYELAASLVDTNSSYIRNGI